MSSNRYTPAGLLKQFLYAGILLGFFLSCDSPFSSGFQSGLGPKVDIYPPIIVPVSPLDGDFVRGNQVFTGTAEDDTGVAEVWLRIQQPDDSWGPWDRVSFDAATGIWTHQIDTRAQNGGHDGPLSLQFRVLDKSQPHKVTITDPIKFTIKNSPPSIEMGIPMIHEENILQPLEIQTVSAGGDLIGLALDRQGIARGYPRIKFWPVQAQDGSGEDYSLAEPPDNHPRYGWQNAVLEAADETSASPVTAKEFRFHLLKQIQVGNHLEFTDPNDPANALPVASYRFRVLVKDVNGIDTYFPDPAGVNPWVEISLESTKEFPGVQLDPPAPGGIVYTVEQYLTDELNYPRKYAFEGDAIFQGGEEDTDDPSTPDSNADSFIFQIIASHGEGIHSAELKWSSAGSGGTAGTVIPWDIADGTDISAAGNRSRVRYRATIPYTLMDGLNEGQYFLTVQATSYSASKIEQPPVWSVFKDKTSPVVNLGQVKGAIYSPNPQDQLHPGFVYTLNGTVEINARATDNRTLRPDTLSGGNHPREFVYLLLPQGTNISGDLDRAGFPGPGLLQDIENGTIPGAGFIGGTNLFQIDTASNSGTPDFPDGPYELHLYARDSALNVSSALIPMYIDQDSDKPIVKVTYPQLTAKDDPALNPPPVGGSAVLSTSPTHILGPSGSFNVTISDDDGLIQTNPVEMKLYAAAGNSSMAAASNPALQLLAAANADPDLVNGLFNVNPLEPKTITRTVSQNFLDAVRNNANTPSTDSLPDGAYYLVIEVRDDAAAKLGGSPAVTRELGFWFAVDTRGPAIEDVDPPENHYATFGWNTITGRVSDLNGLSYTGSGSLPHDSSVSLPVPFDDFTVKVTRADGSVIGGQSGVPVKVADTARNNSTNPIEWDPLKGWMYDWTVDVNINVDEEVHLHFIARDIYGKESGEFVRKVKVDTMPPDVKVNFRPLTVYTDTAWDQTQNSGVGAEVSLPAGTPGTPDTYLNGIVRIGIIASDTSGIKKEAATVGDIQAGWPMIKWWILPEDEWPTDDRTASGVPDYDYTSSAGGREGVHIEGNQPYLIYWDTNYLPSGNASGAYTDYGAIRAFGHSSYPSTPNDKYVLHVLALDNLGTPNTGRFPIPAAPDNAPDKAPPTEADNYVKAAVNQLTDNPLITVTKPAPVTDAGPGKNIVVEAVIRDDDGFADTGAVTIQLSNDDGSSWYGTTITPAYSRANNNTEIRVSYTLSTAEKNYLTDLSSLESVPRQVKITATDRADRKYGAAAAATTLTHTFSLDSLSPEIKFQDSGNSPTLLAENKPYNRANKPPLEIFIKEANLEQVPGNPGEVVVRYRIDGNGDWQPVHLPSSGAGADYSWSGDVLLWWPLETVNGLFNEFDSDFGLNGYGPHFLQVQVFDASGKSTTAQWSFVTDNKGPVLSLTSPGKTVEIDPALLAPAQVSALNVKKAETGIIAEDTPLLKGSFFDEYSPVHPDPQPAGIPLPVLTPAAAAGKFQYRIDFDPTGNGRHGLNPTDGWQNSESDWLTGDPGTHSPLWSIPLNAAKTGGLTAINSSTFLGDPTRQSLSDGFHWVQLRTWDELGNIHESPLYGFRLDSAAPVLSIQSLQPYPGWEPPYVPSPLGSPSQPLPGGVIFKAAPAVAPANYPVFTLTGKVKDANFNPANIYQGVGNPLNNIKVSVGTLELAMDPAPTQDLTDPSRETWDWTAVMTKDKFTALGADGTYTLRISVKDEIGWTDEAEWQFTKDTAPPVFIFNNLRANTQSAGNLPDHEIFKEANPRLQGQVQDLSPLVMLKSNIQNYVYQLSLSDAAYNQSFWNTAAWNLPYPPVQNERNRDVQISISGAAAVLGSTDGSISAPTPVTWNKRLGVNDGTYPLEFTGSHLPDGFYRIEIRAGDRAIPYPPDTWGNGTLTDWRYFYIDRQAPIVDLTMGAYLANLPGTSTARITGAASDANGIVSVKGILVADTAPEPSAADWTGGAVNAALGRVSAPLATGYNDPAYYTWTLDLNTAGVTSGNYKLFVRAEDRAGQFYILSRNFTLDNTPPLLKVTELAMAGRAEIVAPASIDTPNQAAWPAVAGNTALRGELVELESAVDKFYYALGYTGLGWDDATAWKTYENTFEWRLSGDNTAGREAEWWLATNGAVSPSNPGSIPPETATKISLTGSWNWRLSFDQVKVLATGAANKAKYVKQIGTGNQYYLPIYFKAVDKAGNTALYKRGIIIDLDEGRASVEFSNVGGGDRIGGALRLEGRARHDTWVQDVLVRVLDPAVAPPGNFIIEDSSLLDDYTMDVSKNWAAQGWMKASLTSSGPDVNWSIDLNTTGILNPAGAATEREITIEAVAWEPGNLAHTIRGEAGGVRAVTIKFASGIPEFVTEYRIVQPADPAANTALETLWTTGTAYTEQSLGGSFTMIAKVRYRDETPGGERRLDRIRWHDDAMGGVFAANNLLGATSGAPVRASESAVRVGGYWEYLIAVNVDTTQTSAVFSIPQGTRFADKAGVYTITIEAQETMGINAFRAQKSFPLRIDNFYPVGKYTGHYYAVGTNYSLQGAAWDAGLTAPGNWKIKQVMVYFTNPAAGNAFVPVTPGTPVTATENIPVVTGRTNESVPGTIVPTLKTVPKINHTTHKHAGIIIDRQETSDSTGSSGNGNGFLEGFRDTTLTVDTGAAPPSAVVTGKEWSVLFDTTRLPDGPLTLHYIVFDEAGHASYYETTLVVRNSVPEISKVVLGTNLLKEGMSAPSHENEYSRNFETTNFTVRNKFLSVKVYVDKGNAPLHYKLSYITAENLNVQVNGADFVQGNVYAIQSPGTSTDWARLGVSGTPDVGKLFYAAVNGEAGLGDGLVKSFNLSLARTAQDLNASSRLPYAEFTFNGGGADAFGGGAIPNSWANAGEITNPTKQNTVKFLFSVYDSVDTRSSATNPETGAAENPASQHWLQLAAHQIIALNVGNNDLLDPLSRLYDVNPFTEIAVGDNDTETITNAATPEWIGGNMNKGGLYNTGESGEFKPSGHVEPRAIGTNDAGRTAENVALREPGAQATFTRDTLSGKVILRGRAFDEQRVKDVYLDIAAGTAAPAVNRQILGAKAADDGYLESKVAGKVFFVEEKTFSGHTVEWAYIWDTETEPTGLLNGEVTLRASAKDAADTGQHTNGGGTAALNTANQQNYNAITVELAPFVTGVRRTGDPSWVTKRSKQGWYSLSRGETFAVTGYNFPASGAPALQLNSASLGTVTRTSSNEVITTSGLPSAGSASKGGRLALNFGGAQVVNDRKARLNPWNREAAGGIPGSELWDDVRYLHVWNSNAPGTGTNRGYIEGSGSAWDPSITVDPANGDLHAAWAFPGNQQMFIGSNFGPKYEIFKGSDNGYMTDIYFNNMAKTGGVTTYGGSFNNRVGPTVAYFIENTESGNYDGSSSTNWAYYGGVAVFDRFAPNTGISSVTGKGYVVGGIYWWKHSGTGDTTSGPGDRANKVDRFHTNIKTVSAMKGTAEMVYASFYDKYTHSLVFSMTTVGSTNLASQRRITETTANQGNFFVDGSSSDVAVGATAASDVGAYNAIDVDSNGRPVIAYYDATVGTVKIAYATDDTCRNWTKGYALRTGDPLFYGSGTYITMKIARTAVNGDPANTIHLAFVNKNTNSLVYAKGTTARVGPAGGSFDTALVDGSLRVGPLAQISLDANGRPWISYQDTSRANLTEGMKIAYLDPGLYRKNAWDENGQNVSGWETLTVPTRYRVASSDTLNHPRLGMETRPAGLTEAAVPWDGAVAYLAPDYFRIAYYQKPPAPTLFPGSP